MRFGKPIQRLSAAAVLLVAASTAYAEDDTARAAQGPADDGSIAWFEAEVRPILVSRCYECHDAEESEFSGSLRLDHRQGWLEGGDSGPAVDRDAPDQSLLLRAVSYDDPDLQMPPRSKLPERELAVLREWIRRGAPGPEAQPDEAPAPAEFDLQARRASHWAWRPVERRAPPEAADGSRTRDGIDRWIEHALGQKDLAPADPAPSEVWLRRVAYDLTGLPPEPAAVERFVANDSPDERARVVDKMLDDPAFGECWGQHWLDLMRYAETRGHEQDYPIDHAWRYRDYVIRAFNANVPYRDFVVEHLAGDLVDPPRIDQQTRTNQSVQGTGFWNLGEATHSPVDIRGEEAERIDNQIDVVGKAFLGMTVACARCHDHKFDAISTEDYYALCGFVQSSGAQLANVADPETRRRLAQEVVKLNRAHAGRVLQLLAAEAASIAADDGDKHASRSAERRDRLVSLDREDPPVATPPEAGWRAVVDFEATPGPVPHEDWLTAGHAFGDAPIRIGEPRLWRGRVRITDRAAASTAANSPGQTGVYRTRTFEVSGEKLWVCYRGEADGFLAVDSHRTVAGPLHGVTLQPLKPSDEWAWHGFDIGDYAGHRVHFEVKPKGEFELAAVGQGPAPPNSVGATTDSHAARSPATALRAIQQGEASHVDAAVLNRLLDQIETAPDSSTAKRLAKVTAEWTAARDALEAQVPEPQLAPALLDGSGEDERVHVRGSHKRLAEAPTARRGLEALGGAFPIAQGSGRLELARRVASADNPLTARVFVNRVWAKLFGRGLVPTTDNFGALGIPPTHPELLDYLAVEFVDSGWDVKRLVRRLVLTESYGQASQPSEQIDPTRLAEVDPANDLLACWRVRRLGAEAVRDALLAVAGELNEERYGPSVPIHITDFMRHNRSPEGSGPLDGDRRRSVYLEVRRNALSHFLGAFDKPVPFTSMGDRSQSNSPAQALTLLNDPLVHQLTAAWAAKLTERFENDADAVRHACLAAYSRPASEAEVAAVEALVGDATGEMRRQAWADVCLAMVNSKEFIYLR